MNEIVFGVGIFLAVVALVGTVTWYEHRNRRQRREQLGASAEALGLEFVPKPDPSFLQRLSVFQLFGKGRSRKITNMVVGKTDDIDISVFDYQFTTGSGQHSRTCRLTIALLESPRFAVPSFSLRPENVFDKVGSVLGFQDIDFESHPKFSSQHLLKGEDEQRIREFFNDAILSLLEQKPKICVEAVAGKLVAWHSGSRPETDQLKSLFEEAFEIYATFDARLAELQQQSPEFEPRENL